MLHRITTTALLSLSFFVFAPKPASAGHDHPLYRAACEYRDAVREFETLTDRFRCIDRYTETAVDRLYGVSNSLRAVAKNPSNIDRVLDRYYDAVGLHQRIDVGLAAGGPVAPAIAACWNTVQERFAILGRIVEGSAVGGYGNAAFTVPAQPAIVPSPYQVAPTPFRSAPIPQPSTSYRQDPFGPSPFAVPFQSQRQPIRPFPGYAPEYSRWDINPSAFDRPTRNITKEYRPTPTTRDFGPRQLSGPRVSTRSDFLRIGAQLMRLMD